MTDDRAAAFKTADCRTLELTKTSRQTGGETELFERLWLLNDSEGRLSTSFWLSVSFCASFELAAILCLTLSSIHPRNSTRSSSSCVLVLKTTMLFGLQVYKSLNEDFHLKKVNNYILGNRLVIMKIMVLKTDNLVCLLC